MKNIKYHIVRTVERGKMDTPNTYIQYVAKSIGACIKKSLYNQPKPYFFKILL